MNTSVLFRAVAVTATWFLSPLAAAEEQVSADLLGGTWSTHNHGCNGGNRTDALHRDLDGTLWAGCGTNATGYGLFRSLDGGSSWAAVPVAPADAFHEFRVNSISRGHDNALYVAGFRPGVVQMVRRVNTTTAPHPVTDTLTGVAQTGRQFQVGTYRELGDGRAIAEALTSTNLLYRPNAGVGASATGWVRELGTVQILDMTVYGDRFYGAGSRNVEPPRLFLPPRSLADPYQFETLELQSGSGWQGELWGIAVNNRRLVAVGMDQTNSVGRIFVGSGDLYLSSSYVQSSMSAVTGDATTWARGVCIARNRVVVVGERHPLGSGAGRVLLSNDDGTSFTNITPPGGPASISKCVIEPDGTVIVAGAGGYIGIRQDPDWIFRNDYERP